MAATEFTHPSGDWHESKKVANAVRRQCMEEGKLMLLTCGPYDNVIRWIPPLIVNESQVTAALNTFKNALRNVPV
jgi:4-aminobutyrate aminotransferase-like enzyme